MNATICDAAPMSYREIEPPEAMRALVKLAWKLEVPAEGPAWIKHDATPDGCIEIIHRQSGRSRWRGEQPQIFVAGLITVPAQLELSAGSSFVGVRLWPWSWPLISGRSPGEFTDRWLPVGQQVPGIELAREPEEAMAAFVGLRATLQMERISEAVRTARTAGALARSAGMSARLLQRWFAQHVGISPRTYLRLVRFSNAFADLPSSDCGLADHAAAHGFADQAHMSREFRTLAGESAGRARSRANGPFLSGK